MAKQTISNRQRINQLAKLKGKRIQEAHVYLIKDIIENEQSQTIVCASLSAAEFEISTMVEKS